MVCNITFLFPLPLLLFKYFNVVPSFNYTERWYTRKIEQSYDPNAAGNVKRDTINGLVVYMITEWGFR